MTCSWADFVTADPELADAVRASLERFRHHVLATLDRTGAPRVSGTEVQFFGDDLVFGSMPGSRKAADLRRDGRCALHANPGDGSMVGGDVKVAGVAVAVDDVATLEAFRAAVGAPPTPFDLFRLEIGHVVRTSVHPDGDRLVIDSWHPGRPRTTVERR